MNYWRMQLHPDDQKKATFYTTQSIASGFIGLDFAEDVGDLLSGYCNIPDKNKNYQDFAKTMNVGDKVLVIVHHFPFAVVTVDGEYNYMKRIEPELGVWFRHFRRIKNPIYFSDFSKNPREWEQFKY